MYNFFLLLILEKIFNREIYFTNIVQKYYIVLKIFSKKNLF